MSTKKVINLVSKETSGIKKVLEQANNDNTASVIVVSQDKDGYITVSHSSITNGSLAACLEIHELKRPRS